MLTVVSGASGGLIDNLSSATGSLAVDMWTTQARCPHAHSDNNSRQQTADQNWLKITHTTLRWGRNFLQPAHGQVAQQNNL